MIVDLVIPALDEEPNMSALFDTLPVDRLRHVVVADNGSIDRTAGIAAQRGAVVVYEPQQGYGAACLAALAWIGRQHPPPDAVAFLDGDLADDPRWLARLCEPIEKSQADLVMGSRIRLADPGALEPHRRFGTALACLLIRLTTGRRYNDLGPMRVVRWSSLQQMLLTDRSWGWTVEMQFKAAREGLLSLEIDVPYRKRHAGQSKISGSLLMSLKVGMKMFLTIGRLWWHA